MTVQVDRRAFLIGSGAATAALAIGQTAPALATPDPENPLRLMYNENPYGPGPNALAAAIRATRTSGAIYPDEGELINRLAEYHGVTSDHIAVSSGSTEMLKAAAMAWGRKGPVVTPTPTYSPQFTYAESKGVTIIRVPLNEAFQNDLDALARHANANTGLVYVCNPNNPTGVLVDADRLRDFCRTVGQYATVLIDEAYNDLVDDPEKNSMIDLVAAGENIVLVKTFSKIYGLAGLRVGYAIGRPDLIRTLRDHVMTWVPGPALAAAEASLADGTFYEFSRNKILQGRQLIYRACEQNGLEYVPTQTNFVFVNVRRNADEFAAALLQKGVRVRGADYPPYRNYSRISAGKIEDLEFFARVLPEVVAA